MRLSEAIQQRQDKNAETYEEKKAREIKELLKKYPQIGVVMRRGKHWYYVIQNQNPIYANHPEKLLAFGLVK